MKNRNNITDLPQSSKRPLSGNGMLEFVMQMKSDIEMQWWKRRKIITEPDDLRGRISAKRIGTFTV